MNDAYDFCKRYLVPWLILPLAVIYCADLVVALLSIVQVLAAMVLTSSAIGFLVGGIFGIVAMMPGRDAGAILKLRFNRYLPTLGWGYQLTQWLVQEDDA